MDDEVGDEWDDIVHDMERLLSEYDRMRASEQEFLEDMLERLHEYKERTYMSPKQREWFEQIKERYDV